MCGIVGAVAQREVAAILLEGLRRLEYRGYDSAGIATVAQGSIQRLRRVGKVQALADALVEQPLKGHLGIAHTRWATHGKPSESNAHPHVSGTDIAIVHNGIIENHEALREELIAEGVSFYSETDSEVVAHLIQKLFNEQGDLTAAVKLAVEKMEGAYAIGVIHISMPDRLLVARQGSPLVIGIGIGENFIASDQFALLHVTDRFAYLDEGDIAEISQDQVTIWDSEGQSKALEVVAFEHGHDAADKGELRHYMLKEIYEQPKVVAATLEGRISDKHLLEQVFGTQAKTIFDQVKVVQILACGTSYHAGLVAKYWIEDIVGIPCMIEVASEFRYRKTVMLEGTLLITISQSGETADTLSALREASGYLASLAVCNVPGSTLVRESDLVLMTNAGTEVGVASTKAFTTQLVALMLITIALGRRYGLTEAREAEIIQALHSLPKKLEQTLALNDEVKAGAEAFAEKHHTLFLGRGPLYPIAMEGALKLKEISYIHAEAYPAGELKHGPLALVDKDMPVVTVAPNNELLEKLKSNLQEVRARGGELFVFADVEAEVRPGDGVVVMHVPETDDLLAPIIYTIPLQLLSYYVAVLKGTDVDQPRNLAKSVTVE